MKESDVLEFCTWRKDVYGERGDAGGEFHIDVDLLTS